MIVTAFREFVRLRRKGIVINADGAAGALLEDFGYDPLHMEGLIAISFVPGILASVIEEIKEASLLGFSLKLLLDI
jgi:citrate synthase